jgi:hypothetical protein
MGDQYTEQDSERVRMAEQSSAGMATRQLSLPSTRDGTRGRGQQLGLMLMGLGAILLLARLVTLPIDLTAGMILLTIASVFYFFGFWRHVYGLIIPGSILVGLSVGIPFAGLTDGVSVLWGLALGFLTIFGLGKAIFGQHSQWPVIPAVILFAVGLIVAISNLPVFLGASLIWAPLLLIAAGIYLGWMRKRS